MKDGMIAENAVINSVSEGNGTGYVTITYRDTDDDQMIHRNMVTLIVGRNTRMRDQFGNRIGLWNLQKGMVVNALFSSAMTRSMPPQSRAYGIMVVKENESSIIDIGKVLAVESNDFNFILTGEEDDVNSQMRYAISDETKLRNRKGNPISLRAIRPGQVVRIERASFQTMSIPPQTSALTVQIISG